MDVVLAGRNFDLGYKSDISRDQLPPGVAWRMFDYIPQQGQPLRRRGGWQFSSTDLNVLSACTRIAGVAWAPFQDDPHLVIVADNGKVYQDNLINGVGGTYVGNTGFSPLTQRPFWARDLSGLVIMQALGSGVSGALPPQKYISGGAGTYVVSPLGGSPPLASVGAPYGDWVLLANGYISGQRYANRIWASGVGLPETWTNTQNFFDMPEEVIRIMPLRAMVLVFGYRQIWMLTGDTPPPGGNWTKYDLYATGTMDGRSVVNWNDQVIFANNSGVFMTDGSSLIDLTDQGGISQRWQRMILNFNFSTGWSAVAGIFRGNYVIVVHDNNGVFVTCQVCDLDKRIWYEFTNVPAVMFAERQSGPGTALADGHEELFFAHRTLPRASMLAGCWTPPQAASDGDGTAILPVIELPFYKLQSPGPKQIRNVWITHDLRAPSGGAPTLSIDAIMTPQVPTPAYFNLGALKATTQERRYPIWIRRRGIGVGLRITQVGASSDTALAEIEFESRPLSRNRRG